MWKMVESDFTSLAEAMQEEKWNFKPTQGAVTDVRTFAEQVKHVACANEAWAKKLRGETPPDHCDTGGQSPARTKGEILAAQLRAHRKGLVSMAQASLRRSTWSPCWQRRSDIVKLTVNWLVPGPIDGAGIFTNVKDDDLIRKVCLKWFPSDALPKPRTWLMSLNFSPAINPSSSRAKRL